MVQPNLGLKAVYKREEELVKCGRNAEAGKAEAQEYVKCEMQKEE